MSSLKLIKALAFVFYFAFEAVFAQAPAEKYPVDSASVVHAGVPQGELIQLPFTDSKIFPGTTRTVTIYVPAQYDGKKPACLYVNQDAVQFKAPTVFDNLINSKEMPVTIGVFVTPGQVLAENPQTASNRNNRSYEYDGLGDNYARFLLNEVLPFVEKQKTKDGRAILLSKTPTIGLLAGKAVAQLQVSTSRGKGRNHSLGYLAP